MQTAVSAGTGQAAASVVSELAAPDHEVVVDIANSQSFEGAEALEFLEISTAYFGDVEHSFRLTWSAR
jgi:hypothetical protein